MESVNLNNIRIDLYDIFAAIKKRDTEFVIDLIARGGQDINEIDIRTNRTPILWAAERSNIDLVYYLLNKGAKLNTIDIFDRTVLDYVTRDTEIYSLTPHELQIYDQLQRDLREKGAKRYSELTPSEKNGKEQNGGKKRTRRRKHRSKIKKTCKK